MIRLPVGDFSGRAMPPERVEREQLAFVTNAKGRHIFHCGRYH